MMLNRIFRLMYTAKMGQFLKGTSVYLLLDQFIVIQPAPIYSVFKVFKKFHLNKLSGNNLRDATQMII